MGASYSPELLDQARAYVARAVEARRNGPGMVEITRLYTAITGRTWPAAGSANTLIF